MAGGMGKVRWGVLSTASIGRLVIEATAQARSAEFVAVASRDAARARAFADELGLGLSFGSYEELLASEAVDAVYVALPVSMHAEWTVRSLEAGKHVLCEKPLALRAEDAERCFAAAAAAGRLCVEGLMWRHHPRTALARRLVAGGAIGRLASVRAALSVSADPGDIRRSVPLGGGASATSAAIASAPSGCSPESPSACGPSRSPTAPAGSTCAWPRPCACRTTCSPSSTSASTCPAATSWSWSAPRASSPSPTPGCAAPTTLSWNATATSSACPPTPTAPSAWPTPTTTCTASSSTPSRPPSVDLTPGGQGRR